MAKCITGTPPTASCVGATKNNSKNVPKTGQNWTVDHISFLIFARDAQKRPQSKQTHIFKNWHASYYRDCKAFCGKRPQNYFSIYLEEEKFIICSKTDRLMQIKVFMKPTNSSSWVLPFKLTLKNCIKQLFFYIDWKLILFASIFFNLIFLKWTKWALLFNLQFAYSYSYCAFIIIPSDTVIS